MEQNQKYLLGDDAEWYPGMIVYSYFGRKFDTTGMSMEKLEYGDAWGRKQTIWKLDKLNDLRFYYSKPEGGRLAACKELKRELKTLESALDDLENNYKGKEKDWYDRMDRGLRNLLG